MATEFAHAMRAAELELAIREMPSSSRLLELGAGDGWQARTLQERGMVVAAIDIDNGRSDAGRYFPVQHYDGIALPFPDHSFDIVYSSNVLEHVVDFDGIQAELARVLRPGGIAIHCLPTSTWRLWTTLGHPLYAVRWGLLRWLARKQPDAGAIPATKPVPTGMVSMVRLALVSPRHGEHGSLWSEHWLFTRWGWARRFRRCRWRIDQRRACGLFYSGNEIFGVHMPTTFRRLLSKLLGSSTAIYILRPLQTAAPVA